MKHDGKIVIIAGPNGVGKTTFFYQNKLVDDYIFVNADEIAKEIALDQTENNNDVRIIAGKAAINTVYGYLKNRKNFALETTLSGNFPIKVMNQALSDGYNIALNYMCVDSPEHSVKRIEYRVREGGHNVPTLDILRRYHRSLANLSKAIELAHVTRIYDNSQQKYDLLLRLEKGIITDIYTMKFPYWLEKITDVHSLRVGYALQIVYVLK